jgi:hypothetical protein
MKNQTAVSIIAFMTAKDATFSSVNNQRISGVSCVQRPFVWREQSAQLYPILLPVSDDEDDNDDDDDSVVVQAQHTTDDVLSSERRTALEFTEKYCMTTRGNSFSTLCVSSLHVGRNQHISTQALDVSVNIL